MTLIFRKGKRKRSQQDINKQLILMLTKQQHHNHHSSSKQIALPSELSQILPTLDKAITLHDLKNTLNKVPPNDESVRIFLTKLLYFCHKRHYTSSLSSSPSPSSLKSTNASFSEREATDIFFSLTKAFQLPPSNTILRRRLYCCLKEIAPIASNVMMIISSLSQDIINSKENRPAALRALLPILLDDPTSLMNVERLLKQFINDIEDSTTSSSIIILSCSLLLQSYSTSLPLIKRWLPEIQIASQSQRTNYQATLLQYMLRQTDSGALKKLTHDTLNSFSSSGRKSNSQTILITLKHCEDASELDLVSLLNWRSSPMVPLEVCKIVIKRGLSSLFEDVVQCLGRFIKSSSTEGGDLLRYSSLRLLSLLASQYVDGCTLIKKIIKDIESLSSNPSSSSIVVALSIIISIRAGSPSSIEKLLSPLQKQLSSIGDEFKISIITSLLLFSKAHPSKASTILSFLGLNILREENSVQVKESAINTIKSIIFHDPTTKNAALGHLCEFIEDSEYPSLSSMCIYFLGEEGSTLEIGGDNIDNIDIGLLKKIVRFIYNRLILEDSSVRIVCVGALSKLAMKTKGLLLYSSIIDILKTSFQEDQDIGVRMRAKESLWLLEDHQTTFGDDSNNSKRIMLFGPEVLIDDPMVPDSKISKKNLFERRKKNSSNISAENISQFSSGDSSTIIEEERVSPLTMISPSISIIEENSGNCLINGRIIKSLSLTTKNAEVRVSVKCLLFERERKIVNVFQCLNTLDEAIRCVTIGTRINSSDMQNLWSHSVDLLPPGNDGKECMVCYYYSGSLLQPSLQFDCLLRFSMEENSSSYEEYPLSSFGIDIGDYCLLSSSINTTTTTTTKRDNNWITVTETLNLASMSSISDAQKAINGIIGNGIGIIGNNYLTIENGEIVGFNDGEDGNNNLFSLKARFALLAGNAGVAMELSISAPRQIIIDCLFSLIC